jgi:methylmalonyl-CoA mutase C-terminal domain/subunit
VGKRIRVLIAKVGLDSHYRGAIMVARHLMHRGMEVIYIGNQLPEALADAAAQEDVDVVGLSCLSGNHMLMVPRVIQALRHRGMGHVLVLVGGVIPKDDAQTLQGDGVAAVFGTGSSLDDIADLIEERVSAAAADSGRSAAPSGPT